MIYFYNLLFRQTVIFAGKMMNKKNIGFLLAGLLLLPSCMRVPTYKRRSLGIFQNNCTYRHTQNGITLSVKQLSHTEKDYLFNDRTTHTIDDIEAVYFHLSNLSQHDYNVGPASFDLKLVPRQDIDKMIKTTSSTSRFSGAAATSLSPFIFILTALNSPQAYIGVYLFHVSMVLVAPLIATFLAYGIKSVVMNDRISKDLREKNLHKNRVITSGNRYEGLIFVRKSDYSPQFTVTIHNSGDQHEQLIFDVDVDLPTL